MRLTEKNNTGYLTAQKYFPSKEFENKNELESAALLLNKLGQLEDIEEELGIDLITLFKILKRKHIYCVQKYCKEIQQMIMYGECDLTGIFVYEEGFEYPECSHHLSYKDYGKTWALTKEELL